MQDEWKNKYRQDGYNNYENKKNGENVAAALLIWVDIFLHLGTTSDTRILDPIVEAVSLAEPTMTSAIFTTTIVCPVALRLANVQTVLNVALNFRVVRCRKCHIIHCIWHYYHSRLHLDKVGLGSIYERLTHCVSNQRFDLNTFLVVSHLSNFMIFNY